MTRDSKCRSGKKAHTATVVRERSLFGVSCVAYIQAWWNTSMGWAAAPHVPHDIKTTSALCGSWQKLFSVCTAPVSNMHTCTRLLKVGMSLSK